MKVATLVASLLPFLAKDAKPEDITAAIDAQLALDKSAKDAKDKAAADKAAKDKAAADGVLNLEGPETEIVYNSASDEDDDGDLNGMDEKEKAAYKMGKDRAKKAADAKAAKDGNWGLGGKDKKAMDAAIKGAVDTAVKGAVGARDALHDARRKVEPILGAVAYDSAEDVYKAALVKLGITVDGVPPAAYGAMLDVAVKSAPQLASDGAPAGGKVQTMSEAFPGFDRIRR